MKVIFRNRNYVMRVFNRKHWTIGQLTKLAVRRLDPGRTQSRKYIWSWGTSENSHTDNYRVDRNTLHWTSWCESSWGPSLRVPESSELIKQLFIKTGSPCLSEIFVRNVNKHLCGTCSSKRAQKKIQLFLLTDTKTGETVTEFVNRK